MSNQKRVNDGTNANDQYDDRLMINNPENITNGGPNPVKIHRSGNHQMEDSSESINFPESSGENDVGTSSTHYQLSIAETTNTTARLEPSDNEPCLSRKSSTTSLDSPSSNFNLMKYILKDYHD